MILKSNFFSGNLVWLLGEDFVTFSVGKKIACFLATFFKDF